MNKETNKPEASVASSNLVDLADFDTTTASDNGARIPIVHPITKEPIGIFITILGKHSSTFRELVRERINSRIKAESLAVKRGKAIEPKTAEQVESEALEMLVACTTAWDTEVYVDGDPKKGIAETKPVIRLQGQDLQFNANNVLTVYSQMLWLREQVDDAIGDLENFIKA